MPEHVIQRALRRIDELGAISDSADYRLRSLLSPANIRAANTIIGWMRQAGMDTEHTADGSVRGILPGSNPTAKPLLFGSHFDTVIDAGAYDGPLGIISALAAIELLRLEGIDNPFPIHLLGFSDEEGVRFQTTFIGSGAMVGELDESRLSAKDNQGKSLRATLETEGWHDGATVIRYPKDSTRAYVELHIEQGRILEEMNQPAAGVSCLVGQTRLMITVTGQADHAGTTPMPLRRDALAGAAECISSLESISARSEPGVATVGQIDVHPGAANAIPQLVRFSVDLRHPDDEDRVRIRREILASFDSICRKRRLDLEWKLVMDGDATPCDPTLADLLLDSVHAVTGNRLSLVSGAGHDGVALAPFMPVGMVFIRCKGGISHHPDEYASPEDISAGIKILAHFLRRQIQLETPDHA